MQQVPGDVARVSYVSKGRVETEEAVTLTYELPGDGWWLRQVDLEDGSNETLIQMPSDSEDYVWTPQGGVLTVQGSRLLHWDASSIEADRAAWAEVADLSSFGLKDLSRLALSRDGSHLAVVASR